MANPVYPSDLAAAQDSKFFNIAQEDPSLKSPMEGGYVVSRPRHTRTPRLTFTTGYTCMTDALKLELQAFYASQHGPSLIFDYTSPVTGTVYSVRFTKELAFKYTGIGPTKLWDVTFDLEQA